MCLYALGKLLFSVGRFEEAELAHLQWLSAVQQHNPAGANALQGGDDTTNEALHERHIEVYTMLGSMKLQAGLLKEAEVDLRMARAPSASQMAPANTRLLLADALLQQQRLDVRLPALLCVLVALHYNSLCTIGRALGACE